MTKSFISSPTTVTENRYVSLSSIHWWDQARVQAATVLVVGVGASGNEVLKNLALLGIGRLLIADFDTVEYSNLTRSILFRARDHERPKAEVAALSVRDINPDVAVKWIQGDIAHTLGAGVYRYVDGVISCVDNREARLAINRACWHVQRPWVDGAMQEFNSEIRVFWPGRGACYECILTPRDYRQMSRRYSCSALRHDNIAEGRIPTTPTTASILGALQTQEVLKLLHGRTVQPGRGLVFNGLLNDFYPVNYPVRVDCPSHRAYDPIVACPQFSAGTTTVRELLTHAQASLGPQAKLVLDYELLVAFECPHGHMSQLVLKPTRLVAESAARCPECGVHRWPHQTHLVTGHETFLDRSLAEIGVPPLHLLKAESPQGTVYYELTGDCDVILNFD